MKKRLSFIFLCILLVFSLFSCKWGKDKGNGDEEIKDVENLIWSSTVDTVIIAEDVTSDIEKLRYHIFNLTKKAPTLETPSDKTVAHSIFFGELGYAITDETYRQLDRREDLIAVNSSNSSAYCIYASGGSIAVAYTDIFARSAAVDYMTENFTGKHFSARGVIVSNSFATADLVEKYRETGRDGDFMNVAMLLSSEGVASLRRLYSLYGEELYLWLANLYDPDIGGFYYSESARNTVGFLPDLESTGQALNLLENSGLAALYGDWEDMLPEKIKAELASFVIELQDDDGWFYHPQWGKSIGSSRRGRDSGWAVTILKNLGATPKYDTASGSLKGERPNVSTSESELTDRLGTSSVVAVSKVIATATAPELASEAAFKNYLDRANIKENSYSIFHNLNSRITEIKNAGLWNFLLQYLTDNQCDNGLWEPVVSYNAVNGAMKVSSFFNSTYPYPRAEKALESVMSIIERDLDDEIEAIVYVYNPWVCVYNILMHCSAEKKDEFRSMLCDRSPELIDKTFVKLAAFKREDGGFSYQRDCTAHMSQGELVAVEGAVESDVNATSIAISTVVSYMMPAFKVSAPALFHEYDTLLFLDELVGLGTLYKDPLIVEEPVVITFDEYYDETNEANGVIKNPTHSVQNNIGDDDFDENGDYMWFASSIVPNPADNTYDKVLFAEDFVYDKNGNGKFEDNMLDKEMAIGGSNTEFRITNYAITGNCYVFDADIYYAGTNSATQPVAQIMFVKQATSDTSMTLNLYEYQRYGKTFLRIEENFAGADGIKDSEVIGGIPTDEWFNLRIEVYKEQDDVTGKLLIKVKFYLNGVYAGYSDSGYYSTSDSEYVDRTISAVKFAYYRWSSSAFYFNNVYVAKENKSYVHESIAPSGEEIIADNKLVHNFANGITSSSDFFSEQSYKDADTSVMTYIDAADWTSELESVYGIGTKKAGLRLYSSPDPTNLLNKVLKAYTWNADNSTYNAKFYVNDSVMSKTAETYELTFDYYSETIPWLFAQTYTTIEFQSDAGTKLLGLTLAAKEIPEDNKAQSEIVIKTDDGSVIEGFTLECDKWYSFKLEYYYDADNYTNSRMKIYLLDSDGIYRCIYDEILYNKSGYISQLGMMFSCYKIRGVQYFDNVSFAKIDKQYVAEGVVLGDDVAVSGVVSVTDIDSGTPEFPGANDNRGSGLYVDVAEGYSYMTEVPGSADDATSVLYTKGVEGNNKLEIVEYDEDNALKFTHAKDAETRVQFIGNNISDSLVFETDIRFDYLPDDASRGLQLIGVSTIGKNGSIWSGATINLEYSSSLDSYVLRAAGGACTVSVGKWINIRLEIDGLSKGSTVKFYVNNTLVGRAALTAGISGIKGYEMMVPATNSSGASFIGIAVFDNTYVGAKLYDTPTADDSDAPGGDIDGGNAWDEN